MIFFCVKYVQTEKRKFSELYIVLFYITVRCCQIQNINICCPKYCSAKIVIYIYNSVLESESKLKLVANI